jgi:hypothetical protein
MTKTPNVGKTVFSLALSQINDIHPQAKELFNQTDFFQNHLLASSQSLSDEAILVLLTLHPLIVKKSRSDYVCLTDLHLFNWAKQRLGEKTKVPVRLLKSNSKSIISTLILTEYYLSPLVNSLNKQGHKILASRWQQLNEKNSNNFLSHMTPELTTQEKFAKSLGSTRHIFNTLV